MNTELIPLQWQISRMLVLPLGNGKWKWMTWQHKRCNFRVLIKYPSEVHSILMKLNVTVYTSCYELNKDSLELPQNTLLSKMYSYVTIKTKFVIYHKYKENKTCKCHLAMHNSFMKRVKRKIHFLGAVSLGLRRLKGAHRSCRKVWDKIAGIQQKIPQIPGRNVVRLTLTNTPFVLARLPVWTRMAFHNLNAFC